MEWGLTSQASSLSPWIQGPSKRSEGLFGERAYARKALFGKRAYARKAFFGKRARARTAKERSQDNLIISHGYLNLWGYQSDTDKIRFLCSNSDGVDANQYVSVTGIKLEYDFS